MTAPPLARWVAAAGGAGFFPWAPGTAGSLLALPLGCGLLAWGGHLLLLLGVLLASLLGFWAIRAAGATDDPGWVVMDEVAGQWLTLLGLGGVSWLGALVAFALFRLLDITKPGPIGWADRHASASGIMGDDLIAGAIGAAILGALTLWHPGIFR
ncbi:phosphatidylglycerophosphatase A family protein [Acidisoma sp. C75]